MITAIDFGCSRIRSAFRNPLDPQRLSLYVERAEYALIEDQSQHRRTLAEQQIPCAECQDALAVVGNRSVDVKWMSRVPLTPLFADGLVPSDDAPARQMLHVLTAAILPPAKDSENLCAMVVPGVADYSAVAERNRDFLSRLVRMQGYQPYIVNAAEAAILATGGDANFTGASIVLGAETTEICIARFGLPLASASLPVGCNWIDSEIARQFRMFAWDANGATYLDLDAVRKWKIDCHVDIHNPVGERERTLSKLFGAMLDQISRSISQLMTSPAVRGALNHQRLSIMLSGGGVKTNGLAALLTDRLIEHDVADRFVAIRSATDPDLAVVRGALIFAELEARSKREGGRVFAA